MVTPKYPLGQTEEYQSGEQKIASALQRYADNPSAFLSLNQGNEYFTAPGIDGFICYRQHGRRHLQFGGPFAADSDRAELQKKFLDHIHRDNRRVIGVQLQRADAQLLTEAGCVVNQVGASYALSLTDFSLRGKRFVKLRNKISRALRAGLEVAEVNADDYTDQITDIDSRWLRNKGKHVKKLSFLIGEIGGPWQKDRRLFVGHIDGHAVGYISYVPVYGSRPGWLHDLTRRLPDCPPGVTEAINIHAMTKFQEAGASWLHFGFTPFTSLDSSLEFATAGKACTKLIHLIANHGEHIYPAQTQLEYKLKWHPDTVLPEYFAFDGGISLRSLWSLVKATNIL